MKLIILIIVLIVAVGIIIYLLKGKTSKPSQGPPLIPPEGPIM